MKYISYQFLGLWWCRLLKTIAVDVVMTQGAKASAAWYQPSSPQIFQSQHQKSNSQFIKWQLTYVSKRSFVFICNHHKQLNPVSQLHTDGALVNYQAISLLKSMVVNKGFLSWLLISWHHKQEPSNYLNHSLTDTYTVSIIRKNIYWSNVQVAFKLYSHFRCFRSAIRNKLQSLSTVLLSGCQSSPGGFEIQWFRQYRQVSNIRRTKSQHLKCSRTVMWLSFPNPLKPDVKSRMKM